MRMLSEGNDLAFVLCMEGVLAYLGSDAAFYEQAEPVTYPYQHGVWE
jgi:hypothetical protein